MKEPRSKSAGIDSVSIYPVAITVILIVVLVLLGLFGKRLVDAQPGLIRADAHTYIRFARNLSQGNYYLENPLTELSAEHMQLPTNRGEVVMGPVWNTSVTSEGKTVFTVAIGYPLFQSLVYRLHGAVGSLYANFVLYLLMLLAVLGLCREGLRARKEGESSVPAWLLGGLCMLALPWMDIVQFRILAEPWREPLFLACLFGAAWLLFRFRRTGGWMSACGMAFLLGYACSTKEANVIYLPVFGFFYLVSASWWKSGRRLQLILLPVIAGLLGLAPLLAHNTLATGNPLVSPQTIRATTTADKLIEDVDPLVNTEASHASGLQLGFNRMARMGHWYWWTYRHKRVFPLGHPGIALAALIGLLFLCRRPLGWFLFGLMLFHLALYLNWGNMDPRHMLFGIFLYGICLVAGAYFSLHILLRMLRVPIGWAALLAAVPGLVLLGMQIQNYYPVGKAPEQMFHAEDGERVAEFLDEQVSGSPKPIYFTNRHLSEVLDLYATHPVMRLHELANLVQDDLRLDNLLAELSDAGHTLFYIDSADLDPHTRSLGFTLDVFDRKRFRWTHNLQPVAEISREQFNLNYHVEEKASFQLFRVDDWQKGPQTRDMQLPATGAAFLQFDSNRAGDSLPLKASVPLDLKQAEWNLLPLPKELPGPSLVLTIDSDEPVPDLETARLIGWQESFLVRTEMLPDFNDVHAHEHYRPYIDFRTPRIEQAPIRQLPDCVPILCLHAHLTPFKDTLATLPVESDRLLDHMAEQRIEFRHGNDPVQSRPGQNRQYWFTVPLAPVQNPKAGFEPFSLTCSEGFFPRLNAIESHVGRIRFRVPTDDDTAFYLARGRVMPTDVENPTEDWRLRLGDNIVHEGRCFPDPGRTRNRFFITLPNPAESEKDLFEFEGVAALNLELTGIRDRFELHAGGERARLFREALHDLEGSYRWTKGELVVPVPVRPGVTRYRLVLGAKDGHPGNRDRKLTAEIGGRREAIHLSRDLRHNVISISGLKTDRLQAMDLKLSIPAWCPREELGTTDDRQLGFMLDSLIWEPDWQQPE